MRRTLQVKLSDAEFAHYLDVVPTPESRAGIAEFPKQIRRAHPWLRMVDARVRATLTNKPILLTFGMKDPLLARGAVVKKWQADFPQAELIRLEKAGHYIQEDAPDRIVQAIRETFSTE